jgi:hypothetical protein
MQPYQHVQLHSSHVPVHAPAVRNIKETIFAMMEQSQAAERARYADREMCRLESKNDFVRQQLSMHNIASFIARNYTSK